MIKRLLVISWLTLTVPQLQQSTHGFWIFLRLTWGRLFPMLLWCGMVELHLKMFIILIPRDMPTSFIGYPWSPFCPWYYQNSYPQCKKLWCLLVCSTYIESNKSAQIAEFLLHYFNIIIVILWWVILFPLQQIVWYLKEETNECIRLLFPQPWKGEGGGDYLAWGVVLSLIF